MAYPANYRRKISYQGYDPIRANILFFVLSADKLETPISQSSKSLLQNMKRAIALIFWKLQCW